MAIDCCFPLASIVITIFCFYLSTSLHLKFGPFVTTANLKLDIIDLQTVFPNYLWRAVFE